MEQNHINGIRSELKAMEYFNSLGYQIYTPINAQSRADFVYDNGEKLVKVQVKTATWSISGNYSYLQCRLKSRNDYSKMYKDGDFDEIVFVDNDRLWVASWEEVKNKTSICLDCNRPDYKPNSKTYNPEDWLVTAH